MARRTPFQVYVRSLGDLVVLGAGLVTMHYQGAPGWAFTLAVLIGTRASLIATAMDLGALQRDIRRTREETMPAGGWPLPKGVQFPPPSRIPRGPDGQPLKPPF